MKKKRTRQNLPAAPAKKTVTPVAGTIMVSPVMRGIRDVSNWRNALRAADIGQRTLLYDLYENILLDGTVSDAIAKRVEAITDCDIHFTAGGKEVEEINGIIDSLEFERLLEDIIWSRFWGISVDEFVFSDEGFDFCSIPRKHIRPKEKMIVRQQSDSTGISYDRDTMIIQWGKDDDLGLLLKVAPYVIYKRGGFGDWAQFVELFGMPQRIGKYNSTDEASRRLLIQAFETAGAAPYLVVPKESEIETTLMSGSTNGALYNDFRQACNEEILITILGQTMTTRDGASLSQSQVHLAVQEKKHRSDRRYVIRMLNKYFRPLLERRGYPVRDGVFQFVDKRNELTVDELSTLSGLMPIPRSWAYERFGIPAPQNGEEVLGSARNPQKDPEPQTDVEDKNPDKNTDRKTGQEEEEELEEVKQQIRQSDRNLWRRMMDFFGWAPEAKTGAGTIRMKDDDTPDLRLIKEVWNGEELFSPDLFARLSEEFLNAVQTAFKRRSDKLADNMAYLYDAPDDVFLTAMETNLYHFSAAKTLAEVRELNRLLRESKDFREFRQKAEKVTHAFNVTWQKTEYDTAVLTAESAVDYRRLISQRDIFPYWEYLTVADGKVREQHRRLHGVILPNDDPLWDKIYVPNGWNCRCRVEGVMAHQAEGVDIKDMRERVNRYLETREWKMLEAQGWGVNRCNTAQVFTANQMYIRKFPGQGAARINRMTAEKWGLPALSELRRSTGKQLPISDTTELPEQLTDYRSRTVRVDSDQLDSRLSEAIKETLAHPHEVWLNDSDRKGHLDTYRILRHYNDRTMMVCLRIENDELVMTDARKLDEKKDMSRFRAGLLVENRNTPPASVEKDDDPDYTLVKTRYGRVRIHKGHGKNETKENVMIASFLADRHGYVIDLLDNPDDRKSADSHNHTLGVDQEYKVNATPTRNSIDSLLRSAAKQANEIVLWIDSDISLGDLSQVIKDRVRRTANITYLTVVRNGKDRRYSREEIIASDFKIQPADLK